MKSLRPICFTGLMCLLVTSYSFSATPCCSRHGGIDHCDEKSGYFRCNDGQLSNCLCVSAHPFNRTAKVVKVLDPQNIEVEYRGIRSKIGLYGIKSPEHNSSFFPEALRFISDMVLDKSINFEPIIFDRYGQEWAWVWEGKTNLNKELIRRGLSYWDRNRAPAQSELEAIENEARSQKAGIWSLK
jgi:endonuclease YncB( thermonuclease family)